MINHYEISIFSFPLYYYQNNHRYQYHYKFVIFNYFKRCYNMNKNLERTNNKWI